MGYKWLCEVVWGETTYYIRYENVMWSNIFNIFLFSNIFKSMRNIKKSYDNYDVHFGLYGEYNAYWVQLL